MDASIRTDQLTWKGAVLFVVVLTAGGLITKGIDRLFPDHQAFQANKPAVIIPSELDDRPGDDDENQKLAEGQPKMELKELGDGVIGFEHPPAVAHVPRSRESGPTPEALLSFLMSGAWVRGHDGAWVYEFPKNSSQRSDRWMFQDGRVEWVGD